ncbi:DUF4157 domain-containing protein [Candidatus Thiodictyon syntrophicum]
MPDPATPVAAPAPSPPIVRRVCDDCAREDETVRRRTPDGDAPGVDSREAPPGVHAVLNAPGQPLDRGARAFFESRLDRDLGEVRIHTDGAAGRSALAVGAQAYAVGRHIAFAPGRYAPNTQAGRYLLGHELPHTIQQGTNPRTLRRAPPPTPATQPATVPTPGPTDCRCAQCGGPGRRRGTEHGELCGHQWAGRPGQPAHPALPDDGPGHRDRLPGWAHGRQGRHGPYRDGRHRHAERHRCPRHRPLFRQPFGRDPDHPAHQHRQPQGPCRRPRGRDPVRGPVRRRRLCRRSHRLQLGGWSGRPHDPVRPGLPRAAPQRPRPQPDP